MRLSNVLFAAVIVIGFMTSPLCQSSRAEDVRYVSDFLMINVRDQIEPPYSVVSVVKSGDPVRVIDTKENYFQIKTADGKTGWIGKQYIKQETPKPVIIKQLPHEIDSLKAQLVAFQSESPAPAAQAPDDCLATLGNLEQKLRDAENTIEQLEKALDSRANVQNNDTTEVSDDGDAVKLQNDHMALNRDLAKMREEYGQLVAEFDKRGKMIAELQNDLAKQENKTKFLWFGVGALVFFCGLMAGRAGSKKKSKFTY